LFDDAVAWLVDARSRLRDGRILVIDYASSSTESLVRRPWRDWLRTYRDHSRGDHYLVDPGGQDITAELALDQFPAPADACSQAEFLHRWGIEDLVAAGNGHWAAHAAAPDLEAFAMRSRAAEARALLDPSGLGSFMVLEWGPAPS
jgi:SAM-dependent MidA family methyltransferase